MKFEAELAAIETLAKLGATRVRVGDVEVWLGPGLASDEPTSKLETDEERKRREDRDMFYSADG